jgi:hypothetical protein
VAFVVPSAASETEEEGEAASGWKAEDTAAARWSRSNSACWSAGSFGGEARENDEDGRVRSRTTCNDEDEEETEEMEERDVVGRRAAVVRRRTMRDAIFVLSLSLSLSLSADRMGWAGLCVCVWSKFVFKA